MNTKKIVNNGSDSEDSYEFVSYDSKDTVDATTKKMKNLQIEAKKVEKVEIKVEKTENPKPVEKAATPKSQEQEVETNTKDDEESKEKEKPSTETDFKSIKQRCFKFLKEIDPTDLKTVFIVAKTLIKENDSKLEDALLTALSTVDRIYKHALIQDLIPLIPVYAEKIQGWVPVLLNLDFELILSMLPNLANCASKAKCGEKTVVDMRPFLSAMCPQKIAELEKKVPKNEERSFTVDPKNLCGVFKKAEKSLNQEFPDKVVHKGIICDVCDMNPIIGVRYKCAVRPNYDMCSKCVENQPANYPSVRISQPVDSSTPAYHGLHEFVRTSHRVRGFGGSAPWQDWSRGQNWGPRHHRTARRGGCPWKRRGCGRGDPTTFFGQTEDKTKSGSKRKNEEIERKKEEFKRLKQEKRKLKKEIKDLKKGYKGCATSCPYADMTVGSDLKFKVSLKNTGGRAWTANTRATFFKGHKDLINSKSLDISVGPCEVGCSTDILVTLSPQIPGEYTAYFMLVNDDKKFGKFYVTANVQKKPEAKKVDEQDNEKTAKFEYQDALNQLEDMGYPDSEMLRAIVLANDGNTQRCVQLLLDTDMDMNEIYVHDSAQKEKNSKEEENVEGEDDDEEMTIEDGSKEDLVLDEQPKVVEKPEVVEKPKEAAKEKEANFQYEEGLKQLQSFGFPDNEMLRAVLVANDGDVQRCVQLLLH